MASGKMKRARIVYIRQFCNNLKFLWPSVFSHTIEPFYKRNKRLCENWMSSFSCTKVVVTGDPHHRMSAGMNTQYGF